MAALFAIFLLLIPARSLAYVLLAALFSVVLVLIHHIHLLMYVPTIAAIVVLRYYLVQGVTRQNADRRHCRARGHRLALHRRAVLRDDGGAASRIRQLSARAGWPIPRAPIC